MDICGCKVAKSRQGCDGYHFQPFCPGTNETRWRIENGYRGRGGAVIAEVRNDISKFAPGTAEPTHLNVIRIWPTSNTSSSGPEPGDNRVIYCSNPPSTLTGDKADLFAFFRAVIYLAGTSSNHKLIICRLCGMAIELLRRLLRELAWGSRNFTSNFSRARVGLACELNPARRTKTKS